MTHPRHRVIALFLGSLATVLASCAGPVNAVGDWSLNLTNGPNDCMQSDWMPGQSSSGVPVAITQSGSSVGATVGGLYGVALTTIYGSNIFEGTVAADHIALHLEGGGGRMGDCVYTRTVDVSGTITGDTMTGTVAYAFNTNTSADCMQLATCENVQAMNGSRPPTSP